MYATVRELKIQNAFRDENLRRVNEQLLPQMRTIPGFIDYYLVYTKNDTEFAIALFADKKGADAYRKVVNELVYDARANLNLQAMAEGEVVAHGRAPASA